jgi:hypothetical protein
MCGWHQSAYEPSEVGDRRRAPSASSNSESLIFAELGIRRGRCSLIIVRRPCWHAAMTMDGGVSDPIRAPRVTVVGSPTKLRATTAIA